MLVYSGTTDYGKPGKTKEEIAERKEQYPPLLMPHKLKCLENVKIKLIASGCAAMHSLCVDESGTCWSWGRNSFGQLGLGDTKTYNQPTKITSLPGKVTAAACGKSHSVVVLESGASYAWGLNTMGQLGIGSVKGTSKGLPKNEDNAHLTPQKCVLGHDAQHVSCGSEFTMWLCGGQLYSAGSPEKGQLGHGSTHEYNTKDSSVKMAHEPQPTPAAIAELKDKTMAKVACGTNHCVAIDDKGWVYVWGSGDYMRLGLGEQKDELKPKILPPFDGSRELMVCPPDCVLAASSSATAVSGPQSMLYMWGKTKASGDNIRTPQPFMSLSGWKIRSLSFGATTFAAGSELSAITWGQGTCGELAYGPSGKKSAAQPDKVESLEGLTTLQVACGSMFTLFLLDNSSDDEKVKKQLAGLPTFEPDSVTEDAVDEEEDEAPTKGGKRKAPPAKGKATKGKKSK
jgi:alpha-tubulin suppressor-like RCC1 family protein